MSRKRLRERCRRRVSTRMDWRRGRERSLAVLKVGGPPDGVGVRVVRTSARTALKREGERMIS